MPNIGHKPLNISYHLNLANDVAMNMDRSTSTVHIVYHSIKGIRLGCDCNRLWEASGGFNPAERIVKKWWSSSQVGFISILQDSHCSTSQLATEHFVKSRDQILSIQIANMLKMITGKPALQLVTLLVSNAQKQLFLKEPAVCIQSVVHHWQSHSRDR